LAFAAVVKSLIARMNRAESSPESQRRDVDYADLARKSHAKRRENNGRAGASSQGRTI
jgi:hypothetical protein